LSKLNYDDDNDDDDDDVINNCELTVPIPLPQSGYLGRVIGKGNRKG